MFPDRMYVQRLIILLTLSKNDNLAPFESYFSWIKTGLTSTEFCMEHPFSSFGHSFLISDSEYDSNKPFLISLSIRYWSSNILIEVMKKCVVCISFTTTQMRTCCTCKLARNSADLNTEKQELYTIHMTRHTLALIDRYITFFAELLMSFQLLIMLRQQFFMKNDCVPPLI